MTEPIGTAARFLPRVSPPAEQHVGDVVLHTVHGEPLHPAERPVGGQDVIAAAHPDRPERPGVTYGLA